MIDYKMGFDPRRFANNPLEEKFANKWEKINNNGDLLQCLLKNRVMTNDDIKTAGTIIQWLGSHIGQCFLRDVLDIKFIKN